MILLPAGSPVPSEAPGAGGVKRLTDAGQRQRDQDFARLLLAKALPPAAKQAMKQAPDPGGENACVMSDPSLIVGPAYVLPQRRLTAESTPSEAANAVAAMPLKAPQGGAMAVELPAAAPNSADVPAPRATIEAALKGEPLPAVTAGGASESGWEASVREPRGVAIEMRATREASAGASLGGWTLTVASPAMEAALLARHAPRLVERLRLRGLDPAHLRIEEDDDRRN